MKPTPVSSPALFSPAELADLRAHGIVLWADRVIFDAQPPMSAQDIAAVQACCAGPLPTALVQLWQTTAGGRLDYDLVLPMETDEGEHMEAISWAELFWNGSDGYHDLQGWIDHELECAQEAAEDRDEPWSGKLDYLPFGGFEYCDRIYAVVTPAGAPDSGDILAWKKGLPPAWKGALHEGGLATLAPDLPSAFAALCLHEDPLAPTSEYHAGQSLLEALEVRITEHALPRSLADRLVAHYRTALIDWRTLLAQGALARNAAAARVALLHAIETDDAALLQRLAAAGVPMTGALQGTASGLDLAVRREKLQTAAVLAQLTA